jgi:hypothetical protein
MKKEIIQLDINEYLAYILLYAANADFEIGKEELDIIRESVSREDYKRIRKSFDESNDAERLGVIMHYRDAYMDILIDSPAVVNQLKAIFLADDRYPSIENAVFIYLKKLLKI